MTLFVDDIILYLKDTKSTIRKLVDLINPFSKVADYTINTQKLVTFQQLFYIPIMSLPDNTLEERKKEWAGEDKLTHLSSKLN